MRQKTFLSPFFLKDFKKYCEIQNLQVDYIDEYMYILSGLVAFEETRDFHSRISRIAGRKQWENPADSRLFMRRYMELVSTTELFIEFIEKGDKPFTARVVDDLFECFRDIHSNDPVRFSMIINDWGYRMARLITDTYRIMPGKNIEEFTRNITEKLGGTYAHILPGFISILGQNLKEPNGEMLSAVFRIITVMTSDMNIRRKALIEKKLAGSNTGEPGRNDTCPCGSGLKYKKCCMLKNGLVME